MGEKPIIIAGAGIAGLAAALAGWQQDVLVLEKTKAFEAVGAGLQIGPNAVTALRALGAWDAVAPFASSPPEIHLRDGLSGGLLKRLKLGAVFEKRFGAPYRATHRADLHCALLSVASQRKGVAFALGSGVESVVNSSNGCLVHLDGMHTMHADAVVAADGIHSRLRTQIFAKPSLVDSGEEHHRALLATWPNLPGVEMECINIWLLPGGHVVHYPVGHPQRLNLVAVTPKGMSPLLAFPHAADRLKQLMAIIDASAPWPGLYVKQLPGWHDGRLLLLGDAAHGTLPYLAQGAAMSLEDAAVLARALCQSQDLETSFAGVTDARRDRTQKLHLATLAAGRNYHMSGIAGRARNLVLRALPDAMMWRQLDWLYSLKAGPVVATLLPVC